MLNFLSAIRLIYAMATVLPMRACSVLYCAFPRARCKGFNFLTSLVTLTSLPSFLLYVGVNVTWHLVLTGVFYICELCLFTLNIRLTSRKVLLIPLEVHAYFLE